MGPLLWPNISANVQCIKKKAEKTGKLMHTQQSTSKNSDAMEVDATCQQQSGKKVHNRKTYIVFMSGKCYGCRSTDHNKRDGKHEQDIGNHCRKVGHHSQSAKASTWGSLLQLRQLQQNKKPQLHHHPHLRERHQYPPPHLHQPKIVRDKQTYWPS